ncbi:acetyl-CoA C-acetyltransferase [Amphibacillus sp. MSJ-3]|uniref:acetyl-CoA C-acetyltransferase n=1 Tax=Amphibacillus sp. MSJ-3 TaxID=2841505 RepID=UPI001C0EA7ED|nr:acetyl-CoA C-acetyltransferase [Amphibacillus sp. MSJ-3]MBU5594141.1 acetyl-CoA C-acetyltransferase [Amphibacillus sp. MSJ-3]
MEDVVIVSAVRTPIGKFGGSLKDQTARMLGTYVVKEAIKRANLTPQDIDSGIFGNVLQSGTGQNLARQILIDSNVPYEVPAMTINEVCGSGLKAVILGAQQIQLDQAEIVVVGGVESMSNAPHLISDYRWNQSIDDKQLIDSMINDGLTDAFSQKHMGITAEILAEKYNISRKEQDQFAMESQHKAEHAQATGRFIDEIVPIPVENETGETFLFDQDEYIRKNVNLKDLAKLRTPFKEGGTVTAGNASGINDGGAALILMKKSIAESRGIKHLATIKQYAEVGIDPNYMGYSPYHAIKKLIDKAQLDINQVDLFEINEAFAAQSIPVIRDLGIDPLKVNVNGGGIALGHPIGASGARILVTLLHEMNKTNNRLGIASLCIGGGLGLSMLVER